MKGRHSWNQLPAVPLQLTPHTEHGCLASFVEFAVDHLHLKPNGYLLGVVRCSSLSVRLPNGLKPTRLRLTLSNPTV